ncbi:MAG TPA: IS110 family transposase [Mycobacterium sp.]|jgi:transposase|nr:IS110 family transposase [Mycobacterium sp.]
MSETSQVWVGIDVGKSTHHACAIDDTGKVLWSRKIRNEEPAITELIGTVEATTDRAVWAIDLTSPPAALLIATLLGAQAAVVYVPGRTVNTMSHTFRGEGKTDAKDARVIAETARHRRDLSPVGTTEDLVAELRSLTAFRSDLMADWVRGVNRLRSMLTSIFPALEAAFDYSTRSPLILAAGMCTPAEIRAVKRAGVIKHLRKHQAWPNGIESIADKAVAAADTQLAVLPGEAGTAALIKRLAQRLLVLDGEIKDIDKQITEKFREHPSAAIIESMPGMGPHLGAEFIVITGGNMAAFSNAGRLASFAGLVPVPRDSGRITGNLHRPKRYNRRLRRVFFLAAFSSLRVAGPSRDFYDRKRSENHVHTQALLALARRHVDVLWALLRDHRTWQPQQPAAAAA